MNKKASALLFTLIIITIIGAVALTLSRSVLAGVGFTTNISDSMAAEQASKAGLEYGLLQFKNGVTDLPSREVVIKSSPNEIKFKVTITSANHLATIESIGYAGSVVKRHKLIQEAVGP